MIVFDLVCTPGAHVFEAWFASSEAYENQRAQHLINCPMCASSDVIKALMAPNIPAKSNRRARVAAQAAQPGSVGKISSAAEGKAVLAAVAKAQATLLETSHWVGRDFSNQARAMDAGEIDKSSIYGEASLAEVKSLIDDGIDVSPLPLPVIPPNQCN